MSHDRGATLSNAGLLFCSGYPFSIVTHLSFCFFVRVLLLFGNRAAILGDRAVRCIRARNE